MHLRFSSCVGMEVLVEGSDERVGTLYDVLIHPDTGRVEGFFVALQHFFSTDTLFLSTYDILRWGTHVYVRDEEVLSPPEDRIRLTALMADERTVLGQPVRTQSGAKLGQCKDVQFNTESLLCEWIFPRVWWRWGTALPLSDVVEVRKDAIIVKDPLTYAPDKPADDRSYEVFEPPATTPTGVSPG